MLLEHSAYDEDGQFLAATFMDFGVGEGGTVLAPAALLNAVDDALTQPGRERVTTTPLTPTRVLELLGVIEA